MQKTNKIIMLAALAAAIVLNTGCAALGKPKAPKTHIEFTPKTGALILDSEKQFSAGSLNTVLNTNGTFSLSVTNLSSVNDPAIVGAIMQVQMQQAKSFFDNMTSLNNMLQTYGQAASKLP